MNTRRNFLQKTAMAFSGLLLSKYTSANRNELPNVLILGDSISIGYTPFVQDILATSAKVSRPLLENGAAENCQGTNNGVQKIDEWLGNTHWDVIHFNFGLHDLKHVDPVTGKNSNNPNHPQQANLKQYKKNLKVLVKKLKATNAKLVFATTTPYPDLVDNPLRKPGMYKKYNNVAVKIMNKNKIGINNLCAFMTPRMAELQRPNNVHFTEEGSRALAKQVAMEIQKLL